MNMVPTICVDRGGDMSVTRQWILESQIGTKVTDTVDPLDLQYDRLGRPYIYSAQKGYHPTITYCNFEKFEGGWMTQYGSDIWVSEKEKVE